MEQPAFIRSIRGRIALANLASVAVLLVVGLVATAQFRELGALVRVVSDDAGVMMRLHHVLGEREHLIVSFHKGYAGQHPNQSARARFSALVTDLNEHLREAHAKLVGGEEGPALLLHAADDILAARSRASSLEQLSTDEREVATIEIEESLGDAMDFVAKAELGAGKATKARMAAVQLELAAPERLFWIAAGAGGLVALAISVYLRRRVSRPIEELSRAVARLAQGAPEPIIVSGRDELARLGLAFNEMAQTLTERNRSLTLVLDNVGDGLLSCDRAGNLVGQPSRHALEWLGPPAHGQKLWHYLAATDQRLALTLELGIEQVFEEMLPVEVSLGQLPTELSRDDRYYSLAFRQVLVEGKLERLLVVISDETEHRITQRKEQESRDLFNLASCALREPEGYLDFIADIAKRLGRAAAGRDVMIELHTVKGTSGVMGCENFAGRVHEVESRASSGVPVQDSVRELEGYFQTLVAGCEATLGRTQLAAVVIPRVDYDLLCQLLSLGQARDASLLARSWTMQRVENILERLSANAIRYAERAGKSVRVEVDSGGVAVPRGHLDELWQCLVHLVRNTVAHGIEEVERRVSAGKPAQGKIRLAVAAREDLLEVTVSDDGVGIDWSALGVPNDADDRARMRALLSAGSSAKEVTELSGRGVGLAAVVRAVESLSGSLAVSSQAGQGTVFEATVPVHGWVARGASLRVGPGDLH